MRYVCYLYLFFSFFLHSHSLRWEIWDDGYAYIIMVWFSEERQYMEFGPMYGGKSAAHRCTNRRDSCLIFCYPLTDLYAFVNICIRIKHTVFAVLQGVTNMALSFTSFGLYIGYLAWTSLSISGYVSTMELCVVGLYDVLTRKLKIVRLKWA